jgi:hypothetical protein
MDVSRKPPEDLQINDNRLLVEKNRKKGRRNIRRGERRAIEEPRPNAAGRKTAKKT